MVGVGCGLEQYSHAALLNMLLITVGVSVASLGVMNFQLQGFLVQLAAIACESTRLAFVQMFLQVHCPGPRHTPGSLMGQLFRATRRPWTHTPSRVAPPVGHHQLHPQGSSTLVTSPITVLVKHGPQEST